MIIRRHKCEVCGVIYECKECAEVSEYALTHHLSGGDNQSSMLWSPDCMKKFECGECKHDRV